MRLFRCVLVTATLSLCAQAQVRTQGFVGWDPLPQADRQNGTPRVDPNAGVEGLFWRVRVADEYDGHTVKRYFFNYGRLKVFTAEGTEKAGTINIPYGRKDSVFNVTARTIRPDGSIIDLKKEDVHDTTVLRAGKYRVNQKSFAVPGVEPGAIIEYRWSEERGEGSLYHTRLQFQREFPIQKVTYYVKPLSSELSAYQMRMWTFNCTPSPLQIEKDGYSSTTLDNVAAFPRRENDAG